MEKKELWMSKLKEKLEDFSEPIPTSGWERLEKELMPPVAKKIYPYRKWTVAAAAVVLLALVSSLSLYFLGTPAADEMRQIQTPTLASLSDVMPTVKQPDVTRATVELMPHTVVKDRLAKAEQVDLQNDLHHQTVGIEDADSKKKEEIEEYTKLKEESNAMSGKQAEEKQPNTKSRRPSGKDMLHIPVEIKSSQKGTWSMGLSFGNSGGATAKVGGMSGKALRVSMLSVSNGLMQIPDDQTLVFEEGVPYLRQANKVIDIEHHQPISFGLNVRKRLRKGFSVETGLTYTLLSSDAKMEGSERAVEQKLHYIGIPLRANWNFVDNRLFTLYVSGGGMVEKCVYGKLGSENEKVKPLQFSVSGAIGAQVNATKRVGVYVEPGVAYFFNDGSDMQTIRKESPFNFNIQAGVRFTY